MNETSLLLACAVASAALACPRTVASQDRRELPDDTTFQAILFDRRDYRTRPDGTLPDRFIASFGTFNLNGPIRDSMKMFPATIARNERLRQCALDVDRKILYCILNTDIMRFSATSPQLDSLDLPSAIVDEHFTGIAYDSKRQLILTVEWRGVLHAYDPAKDTWSQLNKLPFQFSREIGYLTYDKHTDRLYAIHHGGPNGRDVFAIILSPEGYVTKTIALDRALIPERRFKLGACQSQLIGFGNKLGLLMPEQFVIVDIDSGKSTVQWKE